MLAGGAVSEKNALLILARLAKAADAGLGFERIEIDAVDAGMGEKPAGFF